MMEYEEFLKRAYAEGWREPNKIADLEMAAYAEGVRMERRRVLGILETVIDGKPTRIMDLQLLINKIQYPNGK